MPDLELEVNINYFFVIVFQGDRMGQLGSNEHSRAQYSPREHGGCIAVLPRSLGSRSLAKTHKRSQALVAKKGLH